MSALALQEALGIQGIRCAVTADGPVALVRVPPGDDAFAAADARRAAVALAAKHGFRSVALEVED